MDLVCNRYGFGVPLTPNFIFNKDNIKNRIDKYLSENFNDSFKNPTIADLPENYLDYCWIPWLEYNEQSLDKVQFRRDLYTPYTLTSRDIEEYDGIDFLLPYRKSYFLSFPIKYILKMLKKHLGSFIDKKCLVLGCGTGECLLMLEAYGIHAVGIESSRYGILNVNPMAQQRVKFGDFLAEVYSIQDKQYDFVFTNLLSWVDKRDINPLLIEINRISWMFITQHLSDGNSYKTRSKKWWQKQFTKAGMQAFPASCRVALCK